MAEAFDGGSPARPWTPDTELDGEIGHWLGELRALIGQNLVGVYLHGSLAVGDFDAGSDVDFMVVLREDLVPGEIGPVHALHQSLCQRPSRWARCFEGSYAPMGPLRRLSTEPRDPPGEPRVDGRREPGTWRPGPYAYPFWFVSEDERPVRREYDNCQLVRWVLREKGVRLLGPPPHTLVDPVSAQDLRREMAQMLACNRVRLATDRAWFGSAYGQASGVLLLARALETLATGEVRSKRSAVGFARGHLAPRWAQLVADAFDVRARCTADPQAAPVVDPRAVDETLAFLDWAVAHSAACREAPE